MTRMYDVPQTLLDPDQGFVRKQGVLHAEDVSLEALAAEVGTPFYAYSSRRLRVNYHAFAAPFRDLNATVHFANKANPNLAVIRTLAAEGAGADITSVGELERALEAGVPPAKIVYSGVGKRRDEIAAALLAGIHQINVESVPELHLVNETAVALDRVAPIALRVNPDVDARTHRKIATGHKETKFGIDEKELDSALSLALTLPGIAFKGFTVHVGSHLVDFEPFREAYAALADIVRRWRAKGITVERLDLGGGVGIPYDGQKLAPFSEYAAIVREVVAPLGCSLAFEPGRRLVGDAGVLVSRVTHVKETAHGVFLILDAGMNDLVRPAMYEARHSIVAVRETPGESSLATYDVVGPVCETADSFGSKYRLPPLRAGALVAILQGGAYASAMASTYNGRPLVPEVLVDGENHAMVRRRIAVAEQMRWESLPFWLDSALPKGG